MKKGGLGSIPKSLAWIDQVAKETPEKEMPVQAAKKEEVRQPQVVHKASGTQKGLPDGWTRTTFIADKNLNEKIKALAYLE